MHTLDRVHIGQIQRRARAGPARLDIAAMRLDPANARGVPARLNDDRLAALQRAAGKRAGHDRSGACQREDTIDGQPGLADVARRRRVGQLARQRRLQRVEPSSGDHRRRHDRRVGKGAVLQPLADVGHRARLVFDQVGFRQRHHGSTHAEVGQDLQMLLRLRHPPIVCRDDQQREVDGADAGHHVLHEVFVSRHVHDADME